MDYSGMASVSYAWKQKRLVTRGLGTRVVSEQASIDQLLPPNAEEIGFEHVITPFLTAYIAKWVPEH